MASTSLPPTSPSTSRMEEDGFTIVTKRKRSPAKTQTQPDKIRRQYQMEDHSPAATPTETTATDSSSPKHANSSSPKHANRFSTVNRYQFPVVITNLPDSLRTPQTFARYIEQEFPTVSFTGIQTTIKKDIIIGAANITSQSTLLKSWQPTEGRTPIARLPVSTTPVQRKPEVIVTRIHHNIPAEEILQEIQSQGYKAKACRRFFRKGTDTPIWKVAVTLKTCLRCGGTHSLAECTTPREQPNCANCNQQHIASYKGCPSYLKTARQQQLKSTRNPASSPRFNMTANQEDIIKQLQDQHDKQLIEINLKHQREIADLKAKHDTLLKKTHEDNTAFFHQMREHTTKQIEIIKEDISYFTADILMTIATSGTKEPDLDTHLHSIITQKMKSHLDAKDFWKTVNKIFNIKSKHRNIPTLNYEGHAATTDKERAETIRNYFSTVHSIPDKPQYNKNIYKLAHFIKRGYHSTYYPQEDVSEEEDQGHEEYTQEITPDDIHNILKHASNTSPGRDGIQYLHLKAAPPILLEALSMIYTASFKIGHIPKIWKSATTIVIPKPGKDHKHPGSYRPISLLPVLGKCLEKIIARRLYKFIEDYNIIPDSQAGIRRNRSTTDQLFHFLQHTSTHRTKGHHTIAAFFDAEKAFDRMWHEGLLLKLRKYNLPTKLTRWIASFLSHRTTNFKIGSSFSSPLHITTGTPQGSTISPILYTMYVGDIPQPENRFTQISQYADDIAIWTSHINPVRTEEYLQQYINRINQWCHDWRLELNPKKSQILYIAKHNRLRRQPYLTLNNAIIPVTNQVRFLGIHIDRWLTLGYQHRLTH
ncbi:hypothetical protein BSL78_10630 [Apostichopus japonicus]|uniref:Reverse transcriptase domain-containing protein n=1 Tax=Stichopus japonicus TaxID=307972 RepID=A0A2G8KWY0_STIJA|nr:hypothetical protein BSL78_10630 [Apostichopus japonicus]